MLYHFLDTKNLQNIFINIISPFYVGIFDVIRLVEVLEKKFELIFESSNVENFYSMNLNCALNQ